MSHPPFPPNVNCQDIPGGIRINALSGHWQACVLRCGWLDEAERLDGVIKELLNFCNEERARGRCRSVRLAKSWREDARAALQAKDQAIKNAAAWKAWRSPK